MHLRDKATLIELWEKPARRSGLQFHQRAE
jgi:hypothetical protein